MNTDDRQLFTISGAARLVGRCPGTLLYWERRGWLVPQRDSSGRRLYTAQQVCRAAARVRKPRVSRRREPHEATQH